MLITIFKCIILCFFIQNYEGERQWMQNMAEKYDSSVMLSVIIIQGISNKLKPEYPFRF